MSAENTKKTDSANTEKADFDEKKIPPGRKINISIWRDEVFQEVSAQAKLLFIYLITSQKSNMLGVYKMDTDRTIAFDLGLDRSQIQPALKELIDNDLVWFSEKSREVMIKSWLLYGCGSGGRVRKNLIGYLQKVEDTGLFLSLCDYLWTSKKHRMNQTVYDFVSDCLTSTDEEFQCLERTIN